VRGFVNQPLIDSIGESGRASRYTCSEKCTANIAGFRRIWDGYGQITLVSYVDSLAGSRSRISQSPARPGKRFSRAIMYSHHRSRFHADRTRFGRIKHWGTEATCRSRTIADCRIAQTQRLCNCAHSVTKISSWLAQAYRSEASSWLNTLSSTPNRNLVI